MPAEPTLRRLKRRPEFLRVQHKGRRWAAPGLVLQACPVKEGTSSDVGYGLTASKKVGSAVQRNRARRRLRALAAANLPTLGQSGTDYVLIARQGTLSRRWPDLEQDLRDALKRVHAPRKGRGERKGHSQ